MKIKLHRVYGWPSSVQGRTMLSCSLIDHFSRENFIGFVVTDTLPVEGQTRDVDVLEFVGTGRDVMEGRPSGKKVRLQFEAGKLYKVTEQECL